MDDIKIPPQLTLVYSDAEKAITEQQGEDLLAILDLLRSIPWLPNPEQVLINGVPEMVVDARELANGLGSMREFAHWVKHWQGEGFVFVEKIINDAGVKNPGRPTTEYWLKADCFKALIMRSKSPRSEEVRKHFVESHKKFSAGKVSEMVTNEERAHALPSLKPLSRLEYAKALVEAEERAEALESKLLQAKAQVEEQAPLVATAEMIGDSKQLHAFRHAASKYGIPQNQFLELLDGWELTYHSGRWHPHATAVQKGLIRDVITDGGYPQAKLTGAGLVYIAQRLLKENLLPWKKRKL